ncbi:MAG: pyridoxal-dependent decarboxylase [Cyanobacteria bacterium J06641_2]
MNNKNFPALNKAMELAQNYLNKLDEYPVGALASVDELRSRLNIELPEIGQDPLTIIEHLADATKDGLVGSAGGRFFAWVIGGSLESALAADWLTSTWDQNAALYACSPAASVAEELAGAWLKDILRLPESASFAFTTGCQMAHLTCLAAARHAVLKALNWDIERKGLCGSPNIKVITSDQRHGSIDRAVRLLGLGSDSLIDVKTDANGRIESTAFEDALSACNRPAIAVLNAGDLNIAAFDDFQKLIPIAKGYGAWVHIDGAFGLMARASSSMDFLLEGVELADSWATDGHKWLNIPFDCGFAIVRDSDSHRISMTGKGNYITASDNSRDQIDWNPEWSRRGRGFPVYAALLELGRNGLENLIDRCCFHAKELVDGLGNLPNTEILWKPVLNQGLVRFIDMNSNKQEDCDKLTDNVILEVNRTGEAFFSGTTWKGMRAMRISVINWRTTSQDVIRAVNAVNSAVNKFI